MIFKDINKLKYNYMGSGVGLASPFIVSASKNTSNINLLIQQLTIPDYHKVMFNNQNCSSYHIAGYGQSYEETLTRVLGETVERYSFMSSYFLLKDQIVNSSYEELSEKNQVLPIQLINCVEDRNNIFNNVTDNTKIDWILLTELFSNTKYYVPFCLVAGKRDGILPLPSMSTGTATHLTQKKALINSLTEIFQLDTFMNTWYGSKRLKRVKIEKDFSDAFDSIIHKTFMNKEKVEIIILEDSFKDSKFKNFITILKSRKNEYPYCAVGIQGGLNYEYAILRSVMEAAAIYVNLQGFYIYEFEKINKLNLDKVSKSYNLDDNFLYWSNYSDIKEKDEKLNSIISNEYISIEKQRELTEEEELQELLSIAKKELSYLFVLDITPSELKKYGFNTIRVIAPELLPMCFPALPYRKHPNFPKGGKNEFFPHPLP